MQSQTQEEVAEELREYAYEYYEEMFDEPRGVHFVEIANGMPAVEGIGAEQEHDMSLALSDFVADCIDLGVRDHKNGNTKRSEEAMMKEVLSWGEF